ncbi:hypothetical protein BKA56DRAFT_677051 [Ilyonectria sp. MPI-CAGE-AT-0026]|nr:hypothetical protein BKA56DRAFT_677051 [Ilyonectria sp. MPI-CAGE-AT-0026]
MTAPNDDSSTTARRDISHLNIAATFIHVIYAGLFNRMLSSRSVLAWLNGIQDDAQPASEPAVAPSLKHAIKHHDRKRRLPSPPSEDHIRNSPPSQMDNPGTPKRPRVAPITNTTDPQLRLSPKRGREEDHHDSDQEMEGSSKPRASDPGVGNRSRPTRSRKKASSGRVSISTSSSPSRRLDSLSLDTDGIVTRQLGIGDKRHPVVLKQMLSKVLKWSKWKGILGSSMREVFGHDLSEHGLDEDDAYSKEPDDHGSTLSPNVVAEIVDYARECFEKSHSEIVWNFEVHYRLLEKVFRVGERPHLVDVISCHSATITKEYLPTAAGSKLVDFCIYINPGADIESGEDYADQANKLRRSLPMLCMNHTSYLGLKAEPISISVETKRSGDDEDDATLQIGTWQAAQWNYLKYLLVRAGGEVHAETALDELGILPAIITQGHQWSFAATTREGSKTILWAKFPFGDTTSLAAVYTIATVVQYLRHWTATVYWEWFKRNILDIIREAPI